MQCVLLFLALAPALAMALLTASPAASYYEIGANLKVKLGNGPANQRSISSQITPCNEADVQDIVWEFEREAGVNEIVLCCGSLNFDVNGVQPTSSALNIIRNSKMRSTSNFKMHFVLNQNQQEVTIYELVESDGFKRTNIGTEINCQVAGSD